VNKNVFRVQLIRSPQAIYHQPFSDFVSFLQQSFFELRQERGKPRDTDLSACCNYGAHNYAATRDGELPFGHRRKSEPRGKGAQSGGPPIHVQSATRPSDQLHPKKSWRSILGTNAEC
jgi:hypothetical protein